MIDRLRHLLRGDADEIARWLETKDGRWPLVCCAVIVIGCGLYGFTVGLWRAPLQSLYAGMKFPLLIFLTCAGNALLNGILAQLLGSRLSFQQTAMAILMSFATVAVILGAFSPISLFILHNTPPLASTTAVTGHSVTLLTHVFLIAYAGIVANRRLLRVLEKVSGSRAIARRVLFSWLAGNLLLGSQLAWILRPFIGSPRLTVEFFRDDPLHGNFYEAVGRAAAHLFR
jgi:hypothetical protein